MPRPRIHVGSLEPYFLRESEQVKPGDRRWISRDSPEPDGSITAVTLAVMNPVYLRWERVDGGWQTAGYLVKYSGRYDWAATCLDYLSGVTYDRQDVTSWWPEPGLSDPPR